MPQLGPAALRFDMPPGFHYTNLPAVQGHTPSNDRGYPAGACFGSRSAASRRQSLNASLQATARRATPRMDPSGLLRSVTNIGEAEPGRPTQSAAVLGRRTQSTRIRRVLAGGHGGSCTVSDTIRTQVATGHSLHCTAVVLVRCIPCSSTLGSECVTASRFSEQG